MRSYYKNIKYKIKNKYIYTTNSLIKTFKILA